MEFSFWKLKKCGSWCSLRLNLRFLEKSYTCCHGKVKNFLKKQRSQIEFKENKCILRNVHKIYYFCPFSLLLDTTLRTMCKLRRFHGESLTCLSSGVCCSSLLSEIYSLYRKNMTAVLSHGSDFLRFFRIVFDEKVVIMYIMEYKIGGWNFCKKYGFCKSEIVYLPLGEIFKISLKINKS